MVSGYEGLAFRGQQLALPPASMKRRTNLAGLDEIIAKWSAIQNALLAGIEFPEPDIDMLNLCDDEQFELSWPILGRVFQLLDD